ncbi:MAG: CHAP domain-containing protein [Gammaproteobacteria bacterium]|nr:CHAP domain-containing protein [Gammaproteobacteria bacterium]MBI5617508.1 CHAP domain-containing protein [Gammaproteobacteria bacterium]
MRLPIGLALLLPLHATAFDGRDIVHVAAAQLGHHDREARCEAQGCYFARGGNWCSEFVSWVYLQSGLPLSGGERLDWLLETVDEIVAWFDARDAFVRRGDPEWEGFVPQPGDYAWVGRADEYGADSGRLHSALVEFVDADGALHTIEGNNAGRPVERYLYPAYKSNSTDNGPANGIVMGFGRVEIPGDPQRFALTSMLVAWIR